MVNVVSPVPSYPSEEQVGVGGVAARDAATGDHLTAVVRLVQRNIGFARRQTSLSLVGYFGVVQPIVLISRSPSSRNEVVTILFCRIYRRIFNL